MDPVVVVNIDWTVGPFLAAIQQAEFMAYTQAPVQITMQIELNADGMQRFADAVLEARLEQVLRWAKLVAIEEDFLGGSLEMPHTHQQIAYLRDQIRHLLRNDVPTTWSGNFGVSSVIAGTVNRVVGFHVEGTNG